MSTLSRRHLLQFASATLAAAGLNALQVEQLGNRYGRALAQPGRRKLALLVGVKDYPTSLRFLPLQGCLTDIQLQRQLLLHRFGFHPDDILTLTDAEASRQGILEAFEQHLIAQARAGDVVLFHFSGHGSQVLDPNPIAPDGLNTAIVPSDASGDSQTADDIMGYTLGLLRTALATENVTAVLDCCYAGGGTRGNLRIRAAQGRPVEPGAAELADQADLRDRLSQARSAPRQPPGTAIAAVLRHQEAADMEFDGFHAGAFTYLLTQYLWHETNTAANAIADLAPSLQQLAAQVPLADSPRSHRNEPAIYFTEPAQRSADAIVTEVNGDRATVWLGGLVRASLNPGVQFAFEILDRQRGERLGTAQLLSRDGLSGQVRLQGRAQPGDRLRELSRSLPPDLALRIGLAPALGNETRRLQTAIDALNRIVAVPYQDAATLYGGPVDYILSRLTAAERDQLRTANPPARHSLGLLSADLTQALTTSFGSPEEDSTAAIARLNATFNRLLAVKLVKQIINGQSSDLAIAAEVVLSGDRWLGAATTVRGQRSATTGRRLAALPVGQRFQVRIANQGRENLNLVVLVLNYDGTIVFAFPQGHRQMSEAELSLPAGQTLLAPDRERGESLLQALEPGFAEILIVASRQPLQRAFQTLRTLAEEQQRDERAPLLSPEGAIQDLLRDLRSERTAGGRRAEFETATLAALAIPFEVVATTAALGD